ncbi:MAG: Pr6Pr family membrane protein [Microbacterium sp.]|uniref:Pr6Pr family membrane protein n=1 Tax=Microbacterium sp. TaxID=51671 RepID=UPI002716266F|nr:Pr6Pr family membrane protein [Microbacterium sp.]MDO8383345.1 Pr6Pr family membrane protein [Microbacterium sp.]
MLRSPAWADFWAVVRILTAVAGVAAIIAQLVRTVSNAEAAGQPVGTVVVNFLSFFTIQSNVAAAVTLTIGALLFWTQGRRTGVEPRWFAILLVCVTTYMVITGIVYNLLLRGIQLPQGETVAWSNEVMHVVIPIVLLLDLFLAHRRRALPWRAVWIIVIYPIVWVIYTLVRGPLVTSPGNGEPYWYPYPFLNPNNPALQPPGYAGVAVYVVVIAVGIIVVGALAVAVGRWRASQARGSEADHTAQ